MKFYCFVICFCSVYVTLYVRVWIEIAKTVTIEKSGVVTLYVRVWIEICRKSGEELKKLGHPLREGVD